MVVGTRTSGRRARAQTFATLDGREMRVCEYEASLAFEPQDGKGENKEDGVADIGKEWPTLVAVKITHFVDGAVALAVRVSHALADAATLAFFVRDWAAEHRARLVGTTRLQELMSVFAPGMLDAAAAGDVDATEPDTGLVEVARELPVHRYDAWISDGNGCPPFLRGVVGMPKEIVQQDETAAEEIEECGTPLPWAECENMAEEQEYYVLHFGAEKMR